MQLKSLHKFFGGLNKDIDPIFLPDGDYVDGFNVRTGSSTESHSAGHMETLQSEVEVLINAIAEIQYYGESIGGDFNYTGYEEILIGTQVWMKKNWDFNYPGSKVYDDLEANRAIYGGLYTWNHIMSSDFCPAGWHVPTEAEIDTLLLELGGALIAGGKMKEPETLHWITPNTGADDSSGFKVLPGGKYDAVYDLLGEMGLFWLQDEGVVPTPPVAFAATTITPTTFFANWAAVIGITGYYLDVATDMAFTAFVAGYNNLPIGNVLTYQVTGLIPDITYYFRVRAYNEVGASGNSNIVSVNYFELLTIMKPVLVRNMERSNSAGLPGTQWTITDKDIVDLWITFDNDLPIELTELGLGIKDKWTVMDTANPANNTDIAEVDWINNKIRYTAIDKVAGLVVGTKVVFFNPFRSWEPVSYTTTLPRVPLSFYSDFAYLACPWLHSDGTFRAIVLGTSGGIIRYGLASSPDFVTWTVLNGGNYMYETGVAPFNKAWMVSGGSFNGSAIRITGTDTFKAYYGVSPDGTSNVGAIVTFDEDFVVSNVPADPIVLDGVTFPAGYSMQWGSIEYFDGKWRLSTCKRGPIRALDQIYFADFIDVDAGTTENVVLIQDGVIAGSWSSTTVEYSILLSFEGKLYMFVSGEGGASGLDGGISFNNRQFGLYMRDDSGTWHLHPQTPHIINPVANEHVYHDLGIDLFWASDHMGFLLGFVEYNNYLYTTVIFRGVSYYASCIKLQIS